MNAFDVLLRLGFYVQVDAVPWLAAPYTHLVSAMALDAGHHALLTPISTAQELDTVLGTLLQCAPEADKSNFTLAMGMCAF